MKKQVKKICKKHNWDLYSVCPFCGLELKVTESSERTNYEFSIDVPMSVCTKTTKSGIVLFKTFEDEKRN